ncbi:glycosyltransferase [archaeon]|jgi:glycosyltransferase involved in cell wall biosynthesis|nr:glycosyltransferase [archaeon]
MKRCIIVLGMHRSGTSLMTGILGISGVYLGGNLISPRTNDNEKGFFEHAEIVDINENILKTLNSSCNDYNKFPKNWIKNKNILEFKEKIKKIIKRDFGKLDIFAIKDPRISILLQLYLEIFKELKISPLLIVMNRKNIEIAKSLKVRNNLSLKDSLNLSKRYYGNLKKYTKERKIEIDFDKLINDPEKIVTLIKKELKIPLRQYRDIKKEIENFLDPNLKHHNLEYKDYIFELGEEIEERNREIEEKNKKIVKETNEIIYKKNEKIIEKNKDIQKFKKVIENNKYEIKIKKNKIEEIDTELKRLKNRLVQKAEENTILNSKNSLLQTNLNNRDNSLTWKLNRKIDKSLSVFFPGLLEKIALYSKKEKIIKKKLPRKKIKYIPPKRKIKKILFINHEESRTGAPRVVFDVAKQIKNYFEVKMVSFKKGSMHNEFAKEFNNIIYSPESLIPESAENHSKKILLKEKPDLVYVNCIVSYIFAIEARKLGIPVIFHIHELEEGFNYIQNSIYKNKFSKSANKFIAVSEKVRNLLIKKENCSPKNIALINAFISSKEILEKSKEKSIEEINKKLNKKSNEILITCVGTACKRKGTDILVETHKILKDKGHNHFKIIWIGEMQRDKEIINSILNREKGFLFLGEKENPFPYLNATDIFVLPSREDPFPLVVLESMALGKPSIVFKNGGGIPEAVNNCCGLVVENMNAKSLANAIIQLSENKELMEKFSKNGKIKQRKNYDSQIIIPKIHHLINEVLKNN